MHNLTFYIKVDFKLLNYIQPKSRYTKYKPSYLCFFYHFPLFQLTTSIQRFQQDDRDIKLHSSGYLSLIDIAYCT